LNDSKAGNSKLKSTKNATPYRIVISAHNQCDRNPILQNIRFSDPCYALTTLDISYVLCRSTMHEYFPNNAKQNAVMVDHLWSLDCPEHRCLYALFAIKRFFNANSCSGNYQINADVTRIVPDIKKPSSAAGFFWSYSRSCLVELIFNVANGCVDQFVRCCRC
jgi:hypothetical protein